jgi:carboxypeptidase Q
MPVPGITNNERKPWWERYLAVTDRLSRAFLGRTSKLLPLAHFRSTLAGKGTAMAAMRRRDASHVEGGPRGRLSPFVLSVVLSLSIGSLLFAQAPGAAPGRTPPADSVVARLREAARTDPLTWERLSYLCDRIGPRLAGTAPFLQAVRWAEGTFRQDGLDGVHLEPVTLEVWVRGHERAVMTAPVLHELPMLGLGESVGTPGVEAPVVMVRSLDEVGPQVKGKIVLFNPVIAPEASGGARYGIYSPLRTHGPSRAAAAGAVAALIRTAPVTSLATPHTGTLEYDLDAPKIPAATIPMEYAEWIGRLVSAGVEVRVRLEMDAHSAGNIATANVVAEVRGISARDEIVLIGAHLDSWDVGQGAQDDGVGVIHVIEAMRLIHALGVAPQRTIRAVLFVNEEHGLDGAKAYAAAHGAERHLAAVESDAGSGPPLEWTASGTPQQLAWLTTASRATGLALRHGGGGADMSPLARAGVLTAELRVDQPRYFDVHHTEADTLDKVDPQALRADVAALATLAWQLANAPAP